MATSSQHQHSRPSGQAVSPRTVDSHGGLQADVIELIMADHRRIRRLREVLDDAVRGGFAAGSVWMLLHVWERLTDLLDVHTRAEEEICYLPMFGPGSRLGQWRRDAVADHEDIREAIAETVLQPVGSQLWWGVTRDVLAASADHLDREERDILASWLPRLTMTRRLELGHQWLAFVAARRLEPPRPAARPRGHRSEISPSGRSALAGEEWGQEGRDDGPAVRPLGRVARSTRRRHGRDG